MKTVTFDETKWKLVPIEPTNDMLYELSFCIDDGHDNTVAFYKKTIAAAPEHKEE